MATDALPTSSENESEPELHLVTEEVSPRLLELEAIVDNGAANFIHVGNALIAIREERDQNGNRLYMQRGFSDFGDYCRDRWGFSWSYANKQMAAAKLAIEIRTDRPNLQLSEWMLRPVVSLPEDKQVEVMERAIKLAETEGVRVTEKHTRMARWELFPPGSNPRTGEMPKDFHPIIKPSDNWNFSPVVYERLDDEKEKDEDGEEKGYGYIPGDLYVNCFWYYTRSGDVVADLMAGSGMAWHIYQDRARWLSVGSELEFDGPHLFDLIPRGPYTERIHQHDAREPLPLERVNYAFLDVPYYKMVEGQYGDHPANLADMDLDGWRSAVDAIASSLAMRQEEGDRVTLVTPNYSDLKNPDSPYVMVDLFVIDAFMRAGYRLFHRVASSRRIQQTQGARMASNNNEAKRRRVMLTDISYVLTFMKAETCP